jgi:hypothetical protein
LRLSIFAIPILFTLSAAQVLPHPDQTVFDSGACACAKKLAAVVAAVEQNYVGYALQIDAPARAAYEQRKAGLRARATSADVETCYYLLHEYLDGFNDPELDVQETGISEPPAPAVQRPRTEAEIKQYFAKNADRLDLIEGFWYALGVRYAIIKDSSQGREFVAFSLNGASVGAVQAEFTANGRRYRARLYKTNAVLRTGATISAGNLLRMGDVVWGREHTWLDPRDPSAPTMRRINAETVVLSIPSSSAAYETKLKALLAQRSPEITRAQTLIVDIRGNAGGDLHLEQLLEPFYQSPSAQKRAVSQWQPITVSSPAQVSYFRKRTAPEAVGRADWQRFLQNLSAHPGEIVAMPIAQRAPSKPNSAGPKWFVIFADNGTRGEAEDFILRSWNSSKVRLVGESTAGGADYLGQNELALPCGLRLRYPTYARSRDVEKNGLNARGIQPDIYISPEENDPIAAVLQRLPDAAKADRK